MDIRLATPDDIKDVAALLKRYHVNTISDEDKPDGFVTTNMRLEQMNALIIEEKGITIAKHMDKLVGFAMAGSWRFWSDWPLFAHMMQKLPEYMLNGQTFSTENTYQYGPICLDKSMRGTGAFEKIFFFSLHSMHARFPFMVTFINQINHRSFAAHTVKAQMSLAGTFQFNQNDYYLLACPTH